METSVLHILYHIIKQKEKRQDGDHYRRREKKGLEKAATVPRVSTRYSDNYTCLVHCLCPACLYIPIYIAYICLPPLQPHMYAMYLISRVLKHTS